VRKNIAVKQSVIAFVKAQGNDVENFTSLKIAGF